MDKRVEQSGERDVTAAGFPMAQCTLQVDGEGGSVRVAAPERADARGQAEQGAAGPASMRGQAGKAAVGRMRIEDALAQQGMYVGTTVGVSMRPMLRNRRDTIIVEPLRGRRLRRFEVPLYRRGDAYVLHRCVEVHPASYTMLGDNCLNKESNIPDERVVGVLTGFYRGDKQVNMDGAAYRAYVRTWYALYPLRRVAMQVRALAGRAKRKLLGANAHADGIAAPAVDGSLDAKTGLRVNACAEGVASASEGERLPAAGKHAGDAADASLSPDAPLRKGGDD